MGRMDEMKALVYDRLMKMEKEKPAPMYSLCFESTWEITLQRLKGTVFLDTGDIPAMWLRDSSAQVYHYLPFSSKYPQAEEAIRQMMRRQMMYIRLDPYANAFNKEENDQSIHRDDTNFALGPKPGFGNANMKSIFSAIRFVWPTASGSKPGKQTGATSCFCRPQKTILDV